MTRITQVVFILSLLYVLWSWTRYSKLQISRQGIISRLELQDLMKTNNFLLIDVRTPTEVASGKIVNSHNIPLNALSEALSMPDNHFEQKFGFTKPSKTGTLVFYCRSGARAHSATQIAKNAGYSNVLNYQGSWHEWSSYLNEAS